MCDTIVATSSMADKKVTFFGKNSDREPDEVQNIKIIPAKKHSLGEMVECTYIVIPQKAETARVFLCQPFWMFGGEMGANEYGVVIGNEAIFTREKPANTGLTGMDLVRLGLERSQSAREALDIIINLLEKYGQGGNCGYRYNLHYMNSFIIADRKSAYVLETVKTWWVWKKIKDFWSISNVISLEKDFDGCSDGLIRNAVDRGYCKKEKDFNFRKCYSGPIMTWAAKGIEREKRSRQLLRQKAGQFMMKDFIEILRDHGDLKKTKNQWNPDQKKPTLCLHAADSLFQRTQTVCSMVARIGDEEDLFLTTAASNPCLSPYFPVFLSGTKIPTNYKEGDKNYDTGSYWWESELFHRKAQKNYSEVLRVMRPELLSYEEKVFSDLEKNNLVMSQENVDHYFNQARELVKKKSSGLEKINSSPKNWLYRNYWQKYNKKNGIPI